MAGPGRPPLDLKQKVIEVLQHTKPLPPESISPITHLEWSSNVNSSLLKYIDDHIRGTGISKRAYERYVAHLLRMLLANQIEALERFLKELAAVCIDQLVNYVHDDRFDEFSFRGGQLVAHFSAASIGKALCESDTWLNNNDINDRFRRLLKFPFGELWEFLFPNEKQNPIGGRDRARTLAILWQIRHNLTHNIGVLTRSDATRFKVLIKGNVDPDCVLTPTRGDLRYVKRFLSEAAQYTNREVGNRLAILLTGIHQETPTLFAAQAKADELSQLFGFSLTVDGNMGVP
jgi:hypothetical protein